MKQAKVMFSQASVCPSQGVTPNASWDRLHGAGGGGLALKGERRSTTSPGSKVNHPQGQRSTTSPLDQRSTTSPRSKVNHLFPGSKVNHLPQVKGQPPPPGSNANHLPQSQRSTTPRVKGQPPPPRIHTGTMVNGRAVRILLECILDQMNFLMQNRKNSIVYFFVALQT